MNKKQLRHHLLQQRQNLPAGQWQEKSQALCQQLRQSEFWTPAPQTVLAYFSFRQEPDLSSLFQEGWGFPRCQGAFLSWHFWHPGQPLERNRWGIQEPRAQAPLVRVEVVDLILVPAVGCDVKGYRLGYGGGFYDRLFSLPSWKSVPKLGVVFQDAFLKEVPVEPWDIPLQGVCTEAGLYLF